MAGKDRVYYERKNRLTLENWKKDGFLDLGPVDNKEVFLLTMALGLAHPKPLEKRDGWLLYRNLDTSDKSLIQAACMGAGDITDENINKLTDFDTCEDYAEQASNAGFDRLAELIADADNDNDALESSLLSELDRLYLMNVKGVE